MDRKQNTLCKIHTLKAIHIGSCITCGSQSPICQTKGCIKHHSQSQKMHNIYTTKDVQKIIDNYANNNQQKRKILKNMINEYCTLFRAEIQNKFQQIAHTVQNLRFQNFILDSYQRKLAQVLVSKRFSQLSCSDIARIIPKMIKAGSLQQKQFNHIKDYLNTEIQNIQKCINSTVLNLPYFRQDQSIVAVQKFTQIADQYLSNVNKKIQKLSFKPKKLKLKYCQDEVFILQNRVNNFKQKFIKLIELNENLKEVQVLQFYCVWNITQQDFQIEFLDAVLNLPFLTHLTLYTGYKVTSTLYIDQMIANRNLQLKIYKKQWSF